MGSLTHLTIGKEQITAKPPRSTSPCSEPYLTGTNILKDPGFENHIANTGGGPNGTEIPYALTAGGLYWPSDNSKLSSWSYTGGWNHYPGFGSAGQFWQISTINPRSGTYHLRWSATGSPRIMRVFTFQTCVLYSTDYVPISAKVQPGDFVRLVVYALAASGTPNLVMRLHFLQAVPGLTQAAPIITTTAALTAAYTRYEIGAFAPPSTSAYVQADFYTNTGSIVYDVDDCELLVEQ